MQRQIFLLAITFLMNGIVLGDYTGIQLLSQQHHIIGSIKEDKGHWVIRESYDIISDTPVSETLSYVGTVRGETIAHSNAGLFTTNILVESLAWDNDYDGKGDYPFFSAASVDATWIFKPLNDWMELTIFYDELLWNYQYTYTEIWLEDITNGYVILHTGSPIVFWGKPGWNPINYDNNYYLDGWETYFFGDPIINSSHLYSMRITTRCSAEIGEEWYSNVNVIFSGNIPAPGAILLGSIGFGCVTLLRRRNAI